MSWNYSNPRLRTSLRSVSLQQPNPYCQFKNIISLQGKSIVNFLLIIVCLSELNFSSRMLDFLSVLSIFRLSLLRFSWIFYENFLIINWLFSLLWEICFLNEMICWVLLFGSFCSLSFSLIGDCLYTLARLFCLSSASRQYNS